MLGIALILILPEIQMELQSLGIESKSIPLAELLLSAGFFIVYLIEELFTFALPESHKYMSHIQTFAEEQDENENNEVPVTSTPVKQSKPNDSDMGIDTVDISLDAITSTSAAEDSANPDNSFTSFNPKYAGSLNSSTQSMFPNYRPNVEASKVQRSTLKHNFQLPKMPSLKLDKTDGSAGSMVKTWTRQELVATVLLSFYSLIEGLVVGLATSHVNLWQLFAVILVYQIIKSFNLGIAMSIGKSSLLSLLLISFSTCLGVGIGIGVASVPSVTQLLIVKGTHWSLSFHISHFSFCRFSFDKINLEIESVENNRNLILNHFRKEVFCLRR